MNQKLIDEIVSGTMDALRLTAALLTAPYYISKAFVMRPLGEPFHWTWDYRVQPDAGASCTEVEAEGKGYT